jgi:hypothetical protein
MIKVYLKSVVGLYEEPRLKSVSIVEPDFYLASGANGTAKVLTLYVNETDVIYVEGHGGYDFQSVFVFKSFPEAMNYATHCFEGNMHMEGIHPTTQIIHVEDLIKKGR